MYTTKSFCNVANFASNVPGVISPIGEISSYGLSFSREVAAYHHSTERDYDLINMRSQRDEVKVQMLPELVDQAIGVVKVAVDRTLTTAGEILITELYEEIMRNATRLGIADVKLGAMVNSGQYWVPSSITWSDNTGAEQNVHRVWLSLEHYINQFTDTEHLVVSPLMPVDTFFAAPSVVQAALEAITPIQMMDRAQEARGGVPATVIRTLEFDYVDITSPDRKFKSYWSVVIYGQYGDNPDSIKDAIVEYVLANSKYGRAQWEAIFPDIFKRTEFIHVPMWNQFSATTSMLRHGVYSPFVKSNRHVPDTVSQVLPSYAPAHIAENTISYYFPYRSLAVANIGNSENRDGKILITDYFPDYMGVGTTDPDFDRMSTNTQAWIFKLLEAIVHAETWFDGYDLSKGYYRTERDGSNFIGFTHDNVQHLVLTKTSLEV